MPFSHPTDPSAIVDVDAHTLGLEGAFVTRQLAHSLTAATGEEWTTAQFDEDDARLKRPPMTDHLIYTHRITRERDGFPCKVLVVRGEPSVLRLAFVLEGQDYHDAYEGTLHQRPRALGPIDVRPTPAQFTGDPADPMLPKFVRHADAVWGRVLARRAEREAVPE